MEDKNKDMLPMQMMIRELNRESDDFIETIYSILPTDSEYWKILGIIDSKKDILAFGNDSKILGRLFEIIVEPYLETVAEKLQLKLSTPSKQTIYPDFIFTNPSSRRKIALDIKTTYRRSDTATYSFTGGSFTSYLRDGKKNIEGKYEDYDKHYILGFVYTRTSNPTTGKFNIKDLENVIPAYTDVEFFVQEKYKIVGDKKGSGNTDNIGTVSYSSVEDFKLGMGPFAFLGSEICDDYWRGYPKNTEIKPIKDRIKEEKNKLKAKVLDKKELKTKIQEIEKRIFEEAIENNEIKFLNLEQYINHKKNTTPTESAVLEENYNKYKEYLNLVKNEDGPTS